MTTIVTRLSKGAALTFTEGDANFNNLNTAKIELTNLSVSTSGDGSLTYNNTTGAFTYTGPGDTQYRAAFSAGTGITITSGVIASTVSPGIADVVADTTPQLGGNLDVNGNQIVSVSNGDITLTPNGTGDVLLSADTVRIGDHNSAATLTTHGNGNLTLSTHTGTNSGTIVINQGNNGNITLTPDGTGRSVIAAINYNEGAIFSVTYASTITPNVTNGNVQTVTLTGNVTFSAFTSPIAGQSLTLKVVQDATGSRLLTSTMKFAAGEKTLSTAANSIDIISVYYDGTNYFASLAKGFA